MKPSVVVEKRRKLRLRDESNLDYDKTPLASRLNIKNVPDKLAVEETEKQTEDNVVSQKNKRNFGKRAGKYV